MDFTKLQAIATELATGAETLPALPPGLRANVVEGMREQAADAVTILANEAFVDSIGDATKAARKRKDGLHQFRVVPEAVTDELLGLILNQLPTECPTCGHTPSSPLTQAPTIDLAASANATEQAADVLAEVPIGLRVLVGTGLDDNPFIMPKRTRAGAGHGGARRHPLPPVGTLLFAMYRDKRREAKIVDAPDGGRAIQLTTDAGKGQNRKGVDADTLFTSLTSAADWYTHQAGTKFWDWEGNEA